MRLDVYLTPDELACGELSGRVVAMVDVLRASTTIAVALANGARAIVPFQDVDEAIERARQFERGTVVLAGERRMLPIPGFDLGNSPTTFTPPLVSGKTILLTTTNGTRTLVASQGARDVVVASYVNLAVITALLRTALRGGTDVVIACAGQDGHYALEDAACAGSLVRAVAKRLSGLAMNDAAHSCALIARGYGDDIMSAFLHSSHGRALGEAGFQDDLVLCRQVDAYPVVPVFTERSITRLGPDRER